MLDYAIKYETELKEAYMKVIGTDRLKYAQSNFIEFSLDIRQDTWEKIQMVSMYDGKLNGYLSATIDRPTNSVSSIVIISFENNSFIFGKDIHSFFRNLLKNFYKINFSVYIGNKVESAYDRLVERAGGRVVGIYKKDVRLVTGEIVDRKVYEITQ